MSRDGMHGTIGYLRPTAWAGVELCLAEQVSRSLPLQFQDWFEIRLILDGSAIIRLARSQLPVASGSFVAIRPGELCGIGIRPRESISFLSLCIDPALLQAPRCQDSSTSAAPRFPALFTDPALHAHLIAIRQAMIEDTLASRQDALMHELTQHMSSCAMGSERNPDAGHPPVGVQRAIRYLREHSAEGICLVDLAQTAGLSKFYFLRLLSAHLGVTPHRYQLLLRISRARALLRSGMHVAEAAADAGFYDQSHLTRCFHAVVGVPPRQFQSPGPERFRLDCHRADAHHSSAISSKTRYAVAADNPVTESL